MPERWGGAEDYEYFMGRWSRILAPKFLEWARVPLEGDVLDVGCGTGSLSKALLSRGTQSVVGIDPSPAYIEYANAHVGRAGKATFRVGNAMDLPFPENGFRAAVSSLVLNHVPDPARAAREMLRVTRTDGLVAACVWDYGGKMEMIRAFWDAAVSLNPDARDLDEGGRSPICRPENLTNLFREASLSGVETNHLDVPLVFSGFDDYWKPFLGGQGPPGGYVVGLSEKNRDDLRERLSSRLERRSDGSIALTSRAWAVRGIKQ